MKPRTILLIGVSVLSLISKSQAQHLAYFDSVPDPVHRYPGGWEAGNPDSVLLDTCASSATYGELFVAKWIAIQFQYHILPTPPGPADTIIEVGWQAIDTNYTATRNAFAAIEAKYGSFVLRKASPEISDTSSDQSNEFAARFDGDVCADSVLKDFQAIPLEKQIGLQDGLIINKTGGVQNPQHSAHSLMVYPNPSGGQVYVLGTLKLPLQLFDDRGCRIRSCQVAPDRIDLSGLPAGAYYLTCLGTTVKIILEK